MDYPPTNTGKLVTASASRSWPQAVCGLLLCLTCGVASAQSSAFMDAALSAQGFLPTDDPYCSGSTPRFLGRNPQSTDLCTSVAVTSIATATAFISADGTTRYNGVVDWVLVELRDTEGGGNTAAGNTVIARKPGFLLSNGRVVDAATWQERSSEDRNRCLAVGSGTALEDDNTCPDLTVEAAISDNLYIVVRHRNHIDIMSAVAVAAAGAGDLYTYDFSSGEGAAWNRGQKLLVGQLARLRRPGVAMMFGGDTIHGAGDSNLIRLATDYNNSRGDVGQAGYLEGDVNLDGTVSLAADLQDILLSNVGAVTQVPR